MLPVGRSTSMEKSELEDALDLAATPSTQRLALAHVTIGKQLSEILKCRALKPAQCEVFSKELLHFSYGGPRYRPSLQFTEAAAEWPIAIVLKPAAIVFAYMA